MNGVAAHEAQPPAVNPGTIHVHDAADDDKALWWQQFLKRCPPLCWLLVFTSATLFLIKPRLKPPTRARLLLTCIAVLLCWVFVELRPLGPRWQPFAVVAGPFFVFVIGICYFAEGVPTKDAPAVTTFFSLVAAASVRQALTVEPSVPLLSDADDADAVYLHELALLVRQVTMYLSCVAVAAHALVVGVRQCDNFWQVTRASVAFGGALRLASALTLRLLGVTGEHFPPTTLEFRSSIFVNAFFLFLAASSTPTVRHELSWGLAHGRSRLYARLCRPPPVYGATGPPMVAQAKLAPAPPAPSSLCLICMDAPNDHALIACGHLCVCSNCAERILAQQPAQCPVCRGFVTGCLKTYIP